MAQMKRQQLIRVSVEGPVMRKTARGGKEMFTTVRRRRSIMLVRW